MTEIKSAGLMICILMVLMAYLKQAIPRGKTTYLMKAIISIFILLSVVQGVVRFDFDALNKSFESSYTRNEEVWKKTAEMVSAGLKNEFEMFLQDQKINARVLGVHVEGNQDGFQIKKVIVSGTEAETAKKLLAGRYQIGIAYVEVQNE